MPDAYAPQAGEFDLSEQSVEELAHTIDVLNSVSPAGKRIDPHRAPSLSDKELRRVSTMFHALRMARAVSADYVVRVVYELLDAAQDLDGFRAVFTERAGPDPATRTESPD